MFGPSILARFLETPGSPDRHGTRWQYHSRSDRHSKVGSWGVALDLLATSALMRRHASEGKIVVGINHRMTDFATQRKKDLDLVIARPNGAPTVDHALTDGREAGRNGQVPTFASLAKRFGICLTETEAQALAALPEIPVAEVGAVLVALEAKACMTAHVKSLPRLYDELNSSHLCVHGASRQALAIGYVQVNLAEEFYSPIRNPTGLATDPEVTKHKQPADALRVIRKIAEIPRRSASSEVGFDGLGITLLDLRNNGGPVTLVTGEPSPQPGDTFNYDSMIIRMANEYDTTFMNI